MKVNYNVNYLKEIIKKALMVADGQEKDEYKIGYMKTTLMNIAYYLKDK